MEDTKEEIYTGELVQVIKTEEDEGIMKVCEEYVSKHPRTAIEVAIGIGLGLLLL